MTEDDLKAIEARANAAAWPALPEQLRDTADLLSRFVRKKGDENVIAQLRAAADEIDALRNGAPALVAEVRRLRKFAKGALIVLPPPIGKALLDDCGIEYAENTTGMT